MGKFIETLKGKEPISSKEGDLLYRIAVMLRQQQWW
jgi:hypothetical protein